MNISVCGYVTSKSPKTANKRRQNPWYKNQVSSLDGRHTRLSDKVRALKAFANDTEVALQETQQELAFALEAIEELKSAMVKIGAMDAPINLSEDQERPKGRYWIV